MAGFLRLRLWPVIRETVRRWNANDGSLLAASIAYYAAFSFFPLLLVLIAALGMALRLSPTAQDAQAQLLRMLSENVAPQLAEQVGNMLTEVRLRAGVGGPLGAATLLYGAIHIFSQLDAAFDRLWQDVTSRPHGFWRSVLTIVGQRLRAFVLLLSLGLLVLSAFVLGLVLTAVEKYAADVPLVSESWGWVRLSAAVALNSLAFTLLYKTMPKVPVRWSHAFCGGLLAAIVWEIGRTILAALVVGSNYSAYGVVGAFIAMMVWVYYASTLLLLGAQLVQVLGHPDPPSLPNVQL